MTDPEPGATQMTNPDLLKLRMIEALLAAIDMDDAKDAAEAMKQIRALVGAEKAEK